jgi:hypothetical protein
MLMARQLELALAKMMLAKMFASLAVLERMRNVY